MQFDCSEDGDTAVSFKGCVNRFNLFVAASGVEEPGQIKALLLHLAGDQVREIVANDDTITEQTDAKAIVDKLAAHFKPQENTMFQMHKLSLIHQNRGEATSRYVTRLKTQANLCGWDGERRNEEIKRQFVLGASSASFRQKILENPNWTLEEIVQKATTKELAAVNGRAIGGDPSGSAVNATSSSGAKSNRNAAKGAAKGEAKSGKKCFKCGFGYPHPEGRECPAKDKECRVCKKTGHFERVCPTKDKDGKAKRSNCNAVATEQTDEPEASYETFSCAGGSKVYKDVRIGNGRVRMLIDSGADVNVMSLDEYKSMSGMPKLEECNGVLRPYASPPVKLQGQFTTTMSANGRQVRAVVKLVEGRHDALLGKSAATALGMFASEEFEVNVVEDDYAYTPSIHH